MVSSRSFSRGLLLLLTWLAAAGELFAQRPASPFGLTAGLDHSNGLALVRFNFKVPPEHVLYSAKLHFETDAGVELTPTKIPPPQVLPDPVTGHEKSVYNHSFAAELQLGAVLPAELIVRFQGCSNSACYFPERHAFTLTTNSIAPAAPPPAEPATESARPAVGFTQVWQADAEAYRVVGRETGYMPANNFLAFLSAAKSGHGMGEGPLARFERLGLAATLFFIVLGGIGLNLTPCVLPLIPINLAIIGAGARAKSRGRGFALGGIYGAGMALTYGMLGLAVVLTGAKFGALNSSVWFNAGIALVFVVMGLAMFDLVNVDFSRFQRGGKPGAEAKSPFVLAFSIGVVASLLAGACVAPVVISVLLLATQLYSQGIMAGLLLPFLLGVGMALPWPFAGAGLSFLPKPGRWMKSIKHVFGVLILVFAAYYGHLGWHLFQARRQLAGVAAAFVGTRAQAAAAHAALAVALRQGRQEGRPVFVDFAASWCKNCLAMDETVFNTAEVKQRLKDFIVVQYLAEQPNQAPARQALDYFGVIGLPTYVVLQPKKE